MANKINTLIFSCAIALAASAEAKAGTIFDNFTAAFPTSSGGTYGGVAGFTGTTFTATGSGALALIEFNFTIDGTPITLPAALYASSGGAPGTLLESWNVPVPTYPNDTLTVLTSVLNPVLTAGTQYWFVFNEGSNGLPIEWTANDQNIAGGLWSGDALNTLTQSSSAFATPGIELLTAPEPGTSALLGVGCLLLAGIREALRRRKR